MGISGAVQSQEPEARPGRPTPRKVVGTVLLSWLLVSWALYTLFTAPQATHLGNVSAALNALVSGLAFGGLLLALRLQRKELALQRRELSDTREELRGQRVALEAQLAQFRLQSFESSFFSLLGFHREVSNSIIASVVEHGRVEGRSAFEAAAKAILSRASLAVTTSPPQEQRLALTAAYTAVCGSRAADFAEYYGTLRRLIEFAVSAAPVEPKRYVRIVRSQFASSERILLFSAGIADDTGVLRGLIEANSLLAGMAIPGPLVQYRPLYAESAFDESSIT